MEYPTCYGKRISKRELVRLDRCRSAWNVVHHKFGEVTEDEFDRAYDLLNRCIRYAIASYRMLETETEFNVNEPSRKRKEEQLFRRYERLNEELAYYDVRMDGHVWPHIVDVDKTCDSIVAYLYSFD